MTTTERLAAGEVDVEIIPAGPGAIRFPAREFSEWDAADSSLEVGNIADDERDSIAEITIRAAAYADSGEPVDVSIELRAEEVEALIAALQAVQS